MIKNGKLGLSAHHSIHGHRNVGLLLKDLTLEGYEVAGIGLNGAKQVAMQNVQLLGHRTDTPVKGEFSQVVFSLQFVRDKVLPKVTDGKAKM